MPIDEEGYWVFDGRRVDDENLGRELLMNIRPADKNRYVTSLNGQDAWVEAFDAPLIIRHLSAPCDAVFPADGPYHTKFRISLKDIRVDEWDRFHGRTFEEIPYVLSRQAQIEFFDFLDEFDDDSVTSNGHRFPVKPWIEPSAEPTEAKFWTDLYQSPEAPGWELNQEAPALRSLTAQLKLSKLRVLVLGAGSGHDAAFLAQQGHIVTAVDFSEAAVAQLKMKYSGLQNLKIVQGDAFNLPSDFNSRFDLVFEHAFYCAISPERRNDLVKVWKRVLAPGGHLLGVFFVAEKPQGPPFGGSEWEIRQRLKSSFNFIYWTRWRHSVEARKAKELVVYARKI